MRVLICLTYYRPHYSGLTIYVERLARALADRGHRVVVLTSRYDRRLPAYEKLDGVEVHRLDVWLRVSKGVIMPTMLGRAWRFARWADVVNLHVPQLDAAPISLIGRLLGRPIVLTYHCDLHLPAGFIHYVANQVSHLANHVSASSAQVVVTNTRDYAEHSPFLRRYLPRVQVIPPPVGLPPIDEAVLQAFRRMANIQPGQRIIGMAARLAAEKGVEYLVQALPTVLERHPQARVLFVGQHEGVLGEEAYAQRLAPSIARLGEHWAFLGTLPPQQFAAFLHVAEVTVLPSINSTESFGMVQVESMICGTPVIASDLPGVRQPVTMTGMGAIIPPGDAAALAHTLITILADPGRFRGDPQAVAAQFSPPAIAEQYEALFASLAVPVAGRGDKKGPAVA